MLHEARSTRDVPHHAEEGSVPVAAQEGDSNGALLFRAVLESAPIGMALVGLDGRWLLVNRALCRILGYPENELLGLTFQDVTHPDDLEADLENVRMLLTGAIHSYEMEKRYLRRNGSPVWILLSAAVMRSPAGEPLYFVSQVQDISARKEAERALRHSEAKFAGIVSLSTDAILSVDEEQRITLFNRGAERIYGYVAEEVLGQPLEILVPERLRDPHGRTLEAFGVPGVPSRSAWERGTTLIVGRRKGGEEFFAEASVSQLLLGGSRIFTAVVRDVTERVRREERERLLASAGTVLSSSLELEESLRDIVGFAVPALADWCVLDLREPDGKLRVETAATDPAKEAALREIVERYPPDAGRRPTVQTKVSTTGVSRLISEIPEESVRTAAHDEEKLRLLKVLDPRSAMVVPLTARGRTFGSVTFVASESGRRYGPEDLALAEELGRRAALAIENARLYRLAREAREAAERTAGRIARLQNVTAALAGALTPAEVAAVVVREGVEALAASAAVIVVLDEGETELRVMRSHGIPEAGMDEWRRFPVTADVPLAEAVRTGAPVLVPGPEALADRYPALAAVAAHRAWAAVPLLSNGRALGAIGLCFAAPREFSGEDREFLLALGRQCAGALDRACLYEREQRARAQAEAAARARDELLGVVAHDLRNPLTAISMYASLLLDGPKEADAQRAQLQTVLELTEQMNRLIQDLLDVSKIDAGQLRVVPTPLRAELLLSDARELVRMAAEERGLVLEVEPGDGLPPVLADHGRVLQVLSNLLGNAVKFTPRGGRVSVRARSDGRRVEISVSDTGPGIPPEHLARVFDRFWQGDNRRRGSGLGLAIARGIVQAHDGRIWVESTPGLGSTFTFTLPAVG